MICNQCLECEKHYKVRISMLIQLRLCWTIMGVLLVPELLPGGLNKYQNKTSFSFVFLM